MEKEKQETSPIKEESKTEETIRIDTKEALQLILKDKLAIERAVSILITNFENMHDCSVSSIEELGECDEFLQDNVNVRFRLKVDNPFEQH